MSYLRKLSTATRRRERILIGGVSVVKGDALSELVPTKYFNVLPTEIVFHLRWLAQKYNLGQDVFLCGHPGPLRRQLIMTFANLCGFEVEYISCSRDTTESDLKQRREIWGKSVYFHDQPPIRAILNGRLLVLDGIEYAERNVLPTLNNLLENREISLEDGRFITSISTINSIQKSASTNLVAAHPNFRVIALGRSVPPYSGQPMDPPLRSRLQSHFVDELQSETLLDLFANDIIQVHDNDRVQRLLSFYESLRAIRNSLLLSPSDSSPSPSSSSSSLLLPIFSIDSFGHCLSLLKENPLMPASIAVERCVPAVSWMNNGLPTRTKNAIADAFQSLRRGEDNEKFYLTDKYPDLLSRKLLPNQLKLFSQISLDYKSGKHICILGPKV